MSLITLSSIAESEIQLNVIDNNIAFGEKASFELTIKNNEVQKQRYSVYSMQSGQGWNVDPSPLRDRIIEILPGQKYTTKIVAQPLEEFYPGIYYVSILIESDLGERYSEAMKIYLSPESPMDYTPSLKVTLDMDDKIDPQMPVSVKLFIENRNPLNLRDLKIRVQSDIPEFNQETNVNLAPLDKKTVEITLTPSRYQQPGDHIIFFVFEHNDQQVKLLDKKIQFTTNLNAFEKTLTSKNIFFKHYYTLIVKNEGNIKNTQEVMTPTSLWQSLFLFSDGTVKNYDGQRYLTWEMTLSPNQFTEVNYVANYRILFYIIMAIIIFALFYLYAQTAVIIKKDVLTSRGDEDGALSEIKISLEIKNKTKLPIQNVVITDTIPPIANIEKSLELGTLKPTKIIHTKKGTKVTWTLAELDPLEHRLITYKIKAKLNILGVFSLPRSIVEYNKKGHHRRKAYSNPFRLGQ